MHVAVRRRIFREDLPRAAVGAVHAGQQKFPLRPRTPVPQIGKAVSAVDDGIGDGKQSAFYKGIQDSSCFFGRKLRRPKGLARDAVHDKRAVVHDDGQRDPDATRHLTRRLDAARRRIGEVHARRDKAVNDSAGVCAQSLIGAQKRPVQIA